MSTTTVFDKPLGSSIEELEDDAVTIASDLSDLQDACLRGTSGATADKRLTITFASGQVIRCVIEMSAGNNNNMFVAMVYHGSDGGFAIQPLVQGSGVTVTTATDVITIDRAAGGSRVRINMVYSSDGSIPTRAYSEIPTT